MVYLYALNKMPRWVSKKTTLRSHVFLLLSALLTNIFFHSPVIDVCGVDNCSCEETDGNACEDIGEVVDGGIKNA
jgi:hypothetical protein